VPTDEEPDRLTRIAVANRPQFGNQKRGEDDAIEEGRVLESNEDVRGDAGFFEFDVGLDGRRREGLEHRREGRNSVAGAAHRASGEVREGGVRDGPGAVGDAVDRLVVDDDEFVGATASHVELDGVGAVGRPRLERH